MLCRNVYYYNTSYQWILCLSPNSFHTVIVNSFTPISLISMRRTHWFLPLSHVQSFLPITLLLESLLHDFLFHTFISWWSTKYKSVVIISGVFILIQVRICSSKIITVVFQWPEKQLGKFWKINQITDKKHSINVNCY